MAREGKSGPGGVEGVLGLMEHVHRVAELLVLPFEKLDDALQRRQPQTGYGAKEVPRRTMTLWAIGELADHLTRTRSLMICLRLWIT